MEFLGTIEGGALAAGALTGLFFVIIKILGYCAMGVVLAGALFLNG
jgi:hypothetical protein